MSVFYDSNRHGWFQTLQETWQFRETILLMVYQRLTVRYRRSILGFLWAFLNPLAQITVLSLVFSLVLKKDMPEFFGYIATGLLPWQFFQGLVTGLSGVYVGAEGMIKRMYLPLLIFPISQILASIIDLLLAFSAMLLLFSLLGIALPPTIPLALFGIVMLAIFTLGACLTVSVINVYFRDFGFIIGVFFQLWFYATPILWTMDLVPRHLQWIFKVNPFWNFLLYFRVTLMTPESYRNLMLKEGDFDPDLTGIVLKCLLWAVLAFTVGFGIHRRASRTLVFRL